MLGVTQEQHPDRCRLFAQWHAVSWPILHDPINLLATTGVPIVVAIDEHGVVRSTRPTAEWVKDTFLVPRIRHPRTPRQNSTVRFLISSNWRKPRSLTTLRMRGASWVMRRCSGAAKLSSTTRSMRSSTASRLAPEDGMTRVPAGCGLSWAVRVFAPATGRLSRRRGPLDEVIVTGSESIHLASQNPAVRSAADQAVSILRLGRTSATRNHTAWSNTDSADRRAKWCRSRAAVTRLCSFVRSGGVARSRWKDYAR